MPDAALTGTRIRDRRLERRMPQVDLAAAAGISASYLNLIEHNRRRIAGKLLNDIARALGVDPALLSGGTEPGRVETLRARGGALGLSEGDLARAGDLAARFPGWVALIEAQARQVARLEGRVTELSDRLEHDPALARSLHEVLTAATAIHSTASILVESEDLDRDWQSRFSRNIHDESRKLSEASRALVRYLDRPEGQEAAPLDPVEEAEAWLAASDAPARIEAGADPAQLAAGSGLGSGAVWILGRWLTVLAGDAAALPIGPFARTARRAGWDPAQLVRATAQDPARILRRLAALPPGPGQPAMGLAVADGGGAILHLKPDGGFTLPRGGAACPLWPLFRALHQPGQPIRRQVSLPGDGGATWLTHSIAGPADPAAPTDWDRPPALLSTMLVTRTDRGDGADDPLPVGRSCRLCPRPACTARREPSVLGPILGPAFGAMTRPVGEPAGGAETAVAAGKTPL